MVIVTGAKVVVVVVVVVVEVVVILGEIGWACLIPSVGGGIQTPILQIVMAQN